MKVKDLIELLSAQPEDMNVYFYSVDNHFSEITTIQSVAISNLRYLKGCTVDLIYDDVINYPHTGYRRVAEYELDFDRIFEIDPKNYNYSREFVIISNDPQLDDTMIKNKHYVDFELPKLYQTQQDGDLRTDEEEYKEFIRLSQKFSGIELPTINKENLIKNILRKYTNE